MQTFIFLAFMSFFVTAIDMVMSGYGWGDTAINFQLDTWLDRCRRNSIILLHEQPEQIVDKSLIMASAYDGRVHLDNWSASKGGCVMCPYANFRITF